MPNPLFPHPKYPAIPIPTASNTLEVVTALKASIDQLQTADRPQEAQVLNELFERLMTRLNQLEARIRVLETP